MVGVYRTHDLGRGPRICELSDRLQALEEKTGRFVSLSYRC